jgi:ankyrin repeat protein
VEGVNRLFVDGQASPFDLSSQTGSTVLTHAVMGCHSDICSFLINAGADPFAENVFGNRPIDDALDLILTSQLKSDPFEKYFLNGDYYEEKRFSMIHMVATELCPLDIATTLEVSGISVDIRDVDGRTPLAWAAGRRNLAILQTLLSFGANPNSADSLQAVPVFAAVKSGTIETIRLLLAYGADVNATDHWGNTPLHVAALRRRDNDIALLLLSAGAQIDARERSGWTPLSAAVFWRLGPMAQLLIEHGADINNRDNDGMTPLMQAIWLNDHEAISLLLRNNADTSATSKDQRSLLHFAAEYSDFSALKLLATGAQTKPNLEERDIRGNTARAIFDARGDINLHLVNAFTALLTATHVLPPPSRRFNGSPKSFETTASFISSDVWEDAPEIIKPEILQEKLKLKRKRLRLWLGRCTVM